MALIDDVLEWSAGLKEWQRDALRRLFLNDGLDEADFQSLLLMVKHLHGDAPPPSEPPVPLDREHVAGAGSGSTVQLVGLSNLAHINGFPVGRALDLLPSGMTVLFGENGVGKSGYARLLKNACRARRRDKVEPNAFAAVGVPTADIAMLVDGQPRQTTWTQGAVSDGDLSMVSVYDAACAVDYVATEGPPAFLPYGLGQLNRLVAAQKEMQRRITVERDGIALNPRVFDPLRDQTVVGALVEGLGVETDIAAMKQLGELTPDESARITELEQALQDLNPEPRAQALDRQAERLASSAQTARVQLDLVKDEALEELHKLYSGSIEAEAAYELAQQQLRGGDEVLPGTGNSLWKVLFDAAESFSTTDAYPDHPFPHTGDGARCVLCQTELAPDAKERMQRFAAFVVDHAATNAATATATLKAALTAIREIKFSPLDGPTLAELDAGDPALHLLAEASAKAWRDRQEWLESSVSTNDWSKLIPPLPIGERLDIKLTSKSESLKKEAATLRQSADPTARAKLEAELKELKARQAFALLLPQAEQYVTSCIKRQFLDKCITALTPAAISIKMTSLARQYVTAALAESMIMELHLLGYRRDVQPELTGRTEAGSTKVALRIKDSKLDAHKVLSEGEQRAIALALFLAEIRSLPHRSAIIFDDPSTSLDHRYRRKMAERIVAIAAERQVIILTHDAVFLTELHNALRRDGQEASYKSIQWDGAPGQVTDGLTWETMTSKMRLNEIAEMAKNLKSAQGGYMNDRQAEVISQAYSKLRGTIERATREEFMNNTIQPFSNVVSVESFGAVIGHPQEEWDALIDIYDRSCEAIEAHDTPGEHQLPLPEPSQLLRDIEKTIELVGEAAKRRKAYEAARSARNAARKKPFQPA